jgi:flavin-dependent dehydrogenase
MKSPIPGLLLSLFGLLVPWPAVCPAAEADPADVLVYGATGAGCTAAIAAAREGATVILVEPGQHVGGMVSGGLSHTDFGDRTVVGGLMLEFHERVARHYGTRPFYWRGPEPHVAERILRDWLRESGVEERFGQPVESVAKSDGVITSVRFTDGSTLAAKVFVDASCEGDLFARAGVSYAVGRESRAKYGESLAGRQQVLPDMHQFKVGLSPFVNGRDGAVLPLIRTNRPVFFGQGDDRVNLGFLRSSLEEAKGGALGVKRIQEVRIGYPERGMTRNPNRVPGWRIKLPEWTPRRAE